MTDNQSAEARLRPLLSSRDWHAITHDGDTASDLIVNALATAAVLIAFALAAGVDMREERRMQCEASEAFYRSMEAVRAPEPYPALRMLCGKER